MQPIIQQFPFCFKQQSFAHHSDRQITSSNMSTVHCKSRTCVYVYGEHYIWRKKKNNWQKIKLTDNPLFKLAPIIHYYPIYQLGTGGCSQNAQPINVPI